MAAEKQQVADPVLAKQITKTYALVLLCVVELVMIAHLVYVNFTFTGTLWERFGYSAVEVVCLLPLCFLPMLKREFTLACAVDPPGSTGSTDDLTSSLLADENV